jgi:hypothetical protein
MKFTWFNLMLGPLPDDFREKNHSVWVDIPTLARPTEGALVYRVHGQLEYAGLWALMALVVTASCRTGMG